MTNKNSNSARQKQHEILLKEALSRPGVAEYMKVYQGWQERDRGLDSYRTATREIVKTSTTDHANVDHLPR